MAPFVDLGHTNVLREHLSDWRTSESVLSQASSTNCGSLYKPCSEWPTRAALRLRGDPQSMTAGWNAQELRSCRRLVQFDRILEGSVIRVQFDQVIPGDSIANYTCIISCIYWKLEDQYFVTSKDILCLLESLLAVHFTVKEKNRIRRNLASFRSLTVSKNNDVSEEFFRIIMGFPAPRPRTIEKDIKVFHWCNLAQILCKIIGQYYVAWSGTIGSLSRALIDGPSPETGISQPFGANHFQTVMSPDPVKDDSPGSWHVPCYAVEQARMPMHSIYDWDSMATYNQSFFCDVSCCAPNLYEPRDTGDFVSESQWIHC